VGFVFQDYTLFPHMDVFHNVAYGLRVRGESRAATEREVERYLELVDLSGFGRRRVQTLSGGEQQRVAIARSLAARPLLLLLDEPFSSIDTVLRKDLRRQLQELQRELGITMLFVTHNQEEALAISDRVVVMRSGTIAQVGTPGELYRRPASRFVAGFVGEATFLDGTLVGAGDPGRGVGSMVQGFRVFHVRPEGSGRDAPGVGSRVTVMVRPNSLRFGVPGSDAPNSFPVRVVEREYYGHYYEYACAVELPGAVGARVVAYDLERREVGERLSLSFAPDEAVLLPAEDDRPGPAP